MGAESSRQDGQQPELAHCIARSALGDQKAFARLYELTSAKLHSVAVRLLRRRDWAEEVLQDSYISIWHHAADYRADISSPLTWLTTIVRNRCLDRLRRPKLEVEDPDDLIAVTIADERPTPADLAQAASDAKALEDCMKYLHEIQRDAIMLAFFDGLTHAELAECLEQPLGTVKSWVRRGLMQLKDCLQT